MKAESLLRTKIANAMRSRGAHVRVVHQDGHSAGMLDLNAVYRGRAVHVEVKTPDNSEGMSKIQLQEQASVRAAGGVAEEIRSVPAVLALLSDLDRGEI